MGASLACGVRATRRGRKGWVVALADMPWIASDDDRAGRRRPSPTGAASRRRFTAASADIRSVSARRATPRSRRSPATRARRQWSRRTGTAIVRIEVDDAGILRDIDTPGDLT